MNASRKIVVFGASGRVGSKVCQFARAQKMYIVGVDLAPPKHDFCHQFVQSEQVLQVDLGEVCGVVDFSLPTSTSVVCQLCQKYNCPLVTGTTGRNQDEQNAIEQLKKCLPVVSKSNFSVGIDCMKKATEFLCKTLPNWKAKLVETHHQNKVDSPSGTAKCIAKVVESCGIDCPIESIRQGQVFGTHVLTLYTDGQSISICHNAENVDIFAQGALNSLAVLLKEN